MNSAQLPDGFSELDTLDLAQGTSLNLYPWRDLISLHATSGNFSIDSSSGLVVDNQYGLVFTRSLVDSGLGFYGHTNHLPSTKIDHLTTDGFLRVPYRRIPKIEVNTRQQLETILTEIRCYLPEGKLLFRGQNVEYTLNRSTETNTRLYGEPSAREPSLPPSSHRARIDFERLLPEWQWIVNTSCDSWAERVHPGGAPTLDRLACQFSFQRLSMALAQHYGLPSMGLDVTDDLEVALYFATTDIQVRGASPGTLIASRIKPDEDTPPVIFVFQIVNPSRYITYRGQTPHPDFARRPARQSAHFLHRGWGRASNNAAGELIAAIHLRNISNFHSMKSTAELFPEDDPIARIILKVGESASAPMRRLLSHFYWVKDSS